jgi:hypothetical protein
MTGGGGSWRMGAAAALLRKASMSAILEDYFRDWYNSHGRSLDLDDIHDDVANPTHPLHDRYEWDDEKASREYRKQQISRDIRSCRVVYVSDKGRQAAAREYLANREIGRGLSGYTAAKEALQDPDTLRFLEMTLDAEVKNLRRRFEHLVGYASTLEREANASRKRKKAKRIEAIEPPA